MTSNIKNYKFKMKQRMGDVKWSKAWGMGYKKKKRNICSGSCSLWFDNGCVSCLEKKKKKMAVLV